MGLRSDLSSKTPRELLRHYVWQLVGLILVAAFALRFTYEFFELLFVGVLCCLLLGIRNPDAFRFLF